MTHRVMVWIPRYLLQNFVTSASKARRETTAFTAEHGAMTGVTIGDANAVLAERKIMNLPSVFMV